MTIKAEDAEGMTMLHHAVRGTPTETDNTGRGTDIFSTVSKLGDPINPRLPVIQNVLEFARENLWMTEVGMTRHLRSLLRYCVKNVFGPLEENKI